MSLGFFLKGIFTVTCVSILYIHLQMNIIELSYQAKQSQNQIQSLQEDNGRLNFEILRLKSSYHLGGKLLSEDSDLIFPREENIIQVSSRPLQEVPVAKEDQAASNNEISLLQFISMGRQAEALDY